MKYYFLFIILIGLSIRFILVGNTGFIADISFWKSWSLAAIDHGIVWTAHNTNINYPPGFIYVLWLMGKLYSLIGNPHDYYTFWRENNFGFLLVSKSIAIVSDVIIACLIYWFFSQKPKNTPGVAGRSGNAGHDSPGVKKSEIARLSKSSTSGEYFAHPRGVLTALSNWQKINNNLPLLLSSIFFLNPIVILDSAIWGQVESFGILFTLVAILLLFYKRPFLATAIFTTGALMKLQNIIFIPLYFLFILRYFDLKTLLKSLAVATLTFFLINLPFVLAHDLNQVIYLLTVNSDYFPWLSLNAHNLWWIVANTSGMNVSDKITILGILNAKTIGLLLFSSFYLLSSVLLFLKPTPRNLFLSFTLAIFSFFLFTTESHERYSYPVVLLLLLLYPFLETAKNTPGVAAPSGVEGHDSPGVKRSEIARLSKSSTSGEYFAHPQGVLTALTNLRILFVNSNSFWIIYALLTISIFFNLHHGLVLNYPQNGFATLTRISTPQLSIVNSYFLILLFFLLLPFVFSQISKWLLVVGCWLLVVALFALNFSYLIKGKVSLTSLKPIIVKQDFGVLQVNRSVNSYSGWKSWSRLSDDYFYYRKGFGTHANSNLVFDIDRKFTNFETDYGVDTEAGTAASIVFKILADGKELFTSKKMGRFDFPGHTKVDIKGVKYLGLIVTDAGDGINNDHADWLNPVLYK